MFDSSELRMPRKQASWLAAFLIFCFFIAFVVGYYLGKKHERTAEENAVSIQAVMPSNIISDDSSSFIHPSIQLANTNHSGRSGMSDESLYVCQLVGYGTHKKAKAFVDRLSKRGIQSDLKKRVSTTKSGKKITWYQVVTKPHTDKKQLQSLVDRIANLEHIRNYQIVKHS